MNDVGTVRARLLASGIAVDDQQAQEVLEYVQDSTVASRYRGLPIGELEPMSVFDPRWRA
jgi:hypothetical protein